MTPEALQIEKPAVLAEIDAAFADVSRDGGVSWSQADVLDGWGPWDAQMAARARDTETHWRQLVDDPGWDTDTGFGGFNFLDDIGLRYYLPPAMVRCVQRGYDVGVGFQLDVGAGKHRTWQLGRLALLDDRQRRCIARFLSYMMNYELFVLDSGGAEDWLRALESYWNQYLDERP